MAQAEEPDQGAGNANAGAAEEEDAQHHAAGRSHRTQDRYVAPLVLHQHNLAGNDVESCDHDDQRKDQEHDIPLDLNGIEESRVRSLPIDEAVSRPGGSQDRCREPVDAIWVIDHHFDIRHRA